MDNLNVGIVGLGVGERHLKIYQEHANCTVVAAADFSKDKCDEVLERHPELNLANSADEILTNPDINLVSIASYDNFHCEQIITAINNGKHVFVEKPLCLFEEEAKQIRQALNDNPDVSLSCNFVLRTSPRFRELKDNVKAGNYGEIFSIEADYNYGRIHKIIDGWRGKLPFYSVVYGGAVHMIDLVLWMTGVKVLEVVAYGNNIATQETDFKFNDFATALLKCDNGMIIKTAANFACVYPHFHCLNVYGTEGTFVNDLPNARLYKSRDPNDGYESIETLYKGSDKGYVLNSFIDSILKTGEVEVEQEDVFEVMSICFAIEKSIKENKTIKVDYI